MKEMIFSTSKGKKILRYGLFPLIDFGNIIGILMIVKSTRNAKKMKNGFKFNAYKLRNVVKLHKFNY